MRWREHYLYMVKIIFYVYMIDIKLQFFFSKNFDSSPARIKRLVLKLLVFSSAERVNFFFLKKLHRSGEVIEFTSTKCMFP